MNWFDQPIIHFINSFAHHSWIADAIAVQISNNAFIDGGVLMSMFWWAWIEHGNRDPEKRVCLAGNILATACAVVLARLLALSLPYRERPFRQPSLHFELPFTLNPDALIHWSSFPSDHAVLTFCVVAGLWMVSRRLGILAAAYGLVINLARIYSGTHYPTDIIVGMLLGVGMAFLFNIPSIRAMVGAGLKLLDPYPAYLYTLLFACTFEIAEMFNSVRHIAVLAVRTALRFNSGEMEAAGIPTLVALLCLLAWLRWRNHRAVA